MSFYIVQEEDGTSHLDLEESDGDLLREEVSGVERSAALDAVGDISARGFGPFSPSRVSQTVVESLELPLPAARVSQSVVEVVEVPVPATRTSQSVVEVVVLPVVAETRSTQTVVEVLVLPDDAQARFTQYVNEWVVSNRPENVFVVIHDYQIPDDPDHA